MLSAKVKVFVMLVKSPSSVLFSMELEWEVSKHPSLMSGLGPGYKKINFAVLFSYL